MPEIQVPDVPLELHQRLSLRAAAQRVSLSTYVLRVLEHATARPSTGEWLARLEEREPVPDLDATAVVHGERRGRDQRTVRVLRH